MTESHDNLRGWSIICDARHGHNLGVGHLVLVDQQLDSSTWWTSDDPTIVMRYYLERVANRACERFIRSNARVVRYEVALELLMQQNQELVIRTLEREGDL
jgi:hypothetical protein